MSHKAVRIVARQQMPNYRKPSSFLIKETYPLPPYSSVIGLVHTMCGWTGSNSGYRDMKVSIQGNSASFTNDYATNYVFGSIPLDRAWATVTDANGGKSGIVRTPKYYELLTDVELVIHVLPEDQTLVDEIYKAMSMPPVYPSLGRYEDLLCIDSVEVVEITPARESTTTSYDAYIPVASLSQDNLTGTLYRLGKVFEYSKKSKTRTWKERVLTRHVCKGKLIMPSDSVLYDAIHKEVIFPA